MPFWVLLLINVITFLVTELLRPKPNIEDAKPAGLGDFNIPTATEGRPIPIIWGRVKMAGPNVVWYGDLIAEPITEKVKTGMFSSDVVTTGFRYKIGLQLALCRGPVDLLINIRNDESFAWGQDAPSADANLVPTDIGASYFIDEPNYYGGEEAGGGGGLIGGGRIFPGSESQAIAPYLSPFQTPQPAYRGTCYVTWERGEIGLGPQLRVFSFEIQRIPDGLNLAGLQPGDEEIDLGANPLNVIFEVITNTEWGLAQAAGTIDLPNFRAAAATLAAEGNGWSWVWDRQMDVLELIQLIEQQVDGVLTLDPVSGFFTFKLVRFDYTPGVQFLLDETNVKKITRFQRPAWAETQNQVSVQFTDRRKNYTTSFALAQDMGNQDIVQAVNSAQTNYPGVKNPTLANSIAWREIRSLSTPIVTMKIVTDRSTFDKVPGDIVEFSWARFGIVRLPLRITRVDRGKILENEITIDCAQDVFAFNLGSYTDPTDTGWVPVQSEAQPSLRERLWEVPFQLSLDNERHLGVLSSRNGGLHISFDVLSDRPDQGSGNFFFEGTEADFTPTALITAAISRDKGDILPFTQDVQIDTINDITFAQILAAGSASVSATDPANVLLINEEIVFYESAVDDGGGLVTLQTVHFGMFDTIPQDHADNDVVWFVGQGVGLLQRQGALGNPPGPIEIKILPTTIRNRLAEVSAAILSTNVGNRINNPIPPGDPTVNGNRFHDLDGWTRAVGTLDFMWNTRNKITQAFDTLQTSPDVQQPGDVGAHIKIRRVDTAATVVDRQNIFSDQFISTDFLPQASPGIPDELDFTAEISNRTVFGAEGQLAITREFEVFGFGINFGGDFGGEAPNNGIVLPQGAPPFTPDPIPGSGDDRAWTIDFLGSFPAGDDRRLLFDVFDGLAFQSLNFNVFLATIITAPATTEEVAEGVRAFVENALVDRPFTVTRDGSQVRITTRFGDVNLRQQPKSNTVPLNRFPLAQRLQEPKGASTPVKQIVYADWFTPEPGQIFTDLLSPTNDAGFAATGGGQGNRLQIQVRLLTFEQRLANLNSVVADDQTFLAVPNGASDSYDTQFQDWYDQIQASSLVPEFLTIEGPRLLKPGLDQPMARPALVMTVNDNFRVQTQITRTSSSGNPGGPAFNATQFAPLFGLQMLVKEGSPPISGSTTGFAFIGGHGITNGDAPIGTIISITIDGTLFQETVVAGPPSDNYRTAWIALIDQLEADARFEVVNRIDDPTFSSMFVTIVRVVKNVPVEFFTDVGLGLRVEFRDVSP